MVVKTSNITSNKYVFTRKAGRSIIERKPIFSPDGEYVKVLLIINIMFLFKLFKN